MAIRFFVQELSGFSETAIAVYPSISFLDLAPPCRQASSHRFY